MLSVFKAPSFLEFIWLLPLRFTWGIIRIGFWLLLHVVIKPVEYVFSRPMKPIMDGINLVCSWAGDTPNYKWRVVTYGSAILSFLSLLPFVPLDTAVPISLAFLISIFIHEQLHGYGYERAKVPYYLIFIGFLGAAAVTPDKHYKNMKLWDKSIMLLLGPIGSLVAALMWFVFGVLHPERMHFYMMLGGFNLTLVMFNMVALGALDGGRIYVSLMSSLKEYEEKYVTVPMLIVSVVAMVAVFLQSFRFELIIFFLFLMVIGFIKTKGKDDPADFTRPTAMSRKQVGGIMFAYIVLLTVGAVLYQYFPDWSPLVSVHPWIAANWPYITITLVVMSLFVIANDVDQFCMKIHLPSVITNGGILLSLIGIVLVILLIAGDANLGVAETVFSFIVGVSLGYASVKLASKWRSVYTEIKNKETAEIVPFDAGLVEVAAD